MPPALVVVVLVAEVVVEPSEFPAVPEDVEGMVLGVVVLVAGMADVVSTVVAVFVTTDVTTAAASAEVVVVVVRMDDGI